MRHLTILLMATGLLACADNFAFQPGSGGAGGASDDGGADNTGGDLGGSMPGGGKLVGGGGGQGGQLPGCVTGHTICSGDTLLTCDGNSYVDPVDCQDACVAGACEVDLELRLGFDEGSGPQTFDDAQGLVGQLVAAGWTSGHEGSAVLFDGTGTVELGDELSGVGLPFTLSAWVHIPEGPDTNMTVVATDAEPPYQGAYLLVDMAQGGTVVVGYGNAAGTGPAQRHAKRSALGVARGQWVHVAGVFRLPNDASVYIDGQDAGGAYSGSAQFVAGTDAPVTVGRDLDGDAGLVGAVDEVRVYSRALNDAQVMQLATGVVL